MFYRYSCTVRAVALAALCAAPFACLHAHGDFEGIDDLSANLEGYESSAVDMGDTAQQIASDYAAGNDVSSRVEELVGTWEEVDFHEAVETVTPSLYSPIWVAFGRLANAVRAEGNDADARDAADLIERRLAEALGAVKYVAASDRHDDHHDDHGDDGQQARGPLQEIDTIKSNLDEVLGLYRNDDDSQARNLIQRTYMQRFEGIEGQLIAQDAELVTSLEKDFNATLPLLIEDGAEPAEVADQIDTMKTKLDDARRMLAEAEDSSSSVF